MIVYPDAMETALSAAQAVGLAAERVVFFNLQSAEIPANFLTVDDLIKQGSSMSLSFHERTLRAGEARTKLAFLSFSSGNPHYELQRNFHY